MLLARLPGYFNNTFGVTLVDAGLLSAAPWLVAFVMANVAPRHADVIWGISNTFATLPGIIGVYATGWLVDRTGSFGAPFFLTAGISLFGAVVFLVFASGERRID